ncbi:sensitivity to high expression protein she9 [Coemansia thaxteri]|nr:sensitivity to high expression protein she9 [Coemansia thaxteri]
MLAHSFWSRRPVLLIQVARRRQASSDAGGPASKALVPMTVIYLPPPKWHQPLRPLQTRKADCSTAEAKEGVNGRSTEETVAASSSSSKGPKAAAVGSLTARVLRAWRERQPPQRRQEQQPQPRRRQDRAAVLTQAVEGWIAWGSAALNRVTGFDEVAGHKQAVDASGTAFQAARRGLDAEKARQAAVIRDRLSGQREINGLLQRKHVWSEDDVARFAALHRDEHRAEAGAAAAAQALREAERAVDARYDALVAAIRDRYHAEQLWSDKVRRASAYATWAVLLANVVALLATHALVEPRKRRLVVDDVDSRLAAALDAQTTRLADMHTDFERRLQARADENAAPAIVASDPPIRPITSHAELGADVGSSTLVEHTREAPRQLLIPGAMIWRAVRPDRQGQAEGRAEFTRAEAAQLALESAALAGLVAAGLASAYLTWAG